MQTRLRFKSEFGKRSVESESTPPKDIYVISIAGEGLTEEQYFDGIHDMDMSGTIKIDRLEKEKEYENKSHPNHIIELLNERKKYWEEYGVAPDELWMVIDRDKQNVSKEQLDNIFEECKKEGFNLALSNPNFELWLLMHITDLNKYDKVELLENRKSSRKAKKRFIEKKLSEKLGGYNKKNIRFERFKEGISQAVEQAKALETENEDLVDKLGSSVYLLVEKLVK